MHASIGASCYTRATYNPPPLKVGLSWFTLALTMLTKHGILVLFAARTLFALSPSVGQFTIHDSNPYLMSSQMGFSTAPSDSRQVFLDDGLFIGTRLGATEQFLGIPYALPP